jgi:hypothetical protein
MKCRSNSFNTLESYTRNNNERDLRRSKRRNSMNARQINAVTEAVLDFGGISAGSSRQKSERKFPSPALHAMAVC